MTKEAEEALRANPIGASYLISNNTVWPSPFDPNEVQHALRYGNPTREQLMFAASVMHAYGFAFTMTQKRRNAVFSAINRDRYSSLVEKGKGKGIL